jgi:hypothetical protein
MITFAAGGEIPLGMTIMFAALGIGFVAAVVYAVIDLRRHLRGEREGLCPCCSYDLRVGHSCCPECGAAVSRKNEAIG